MSDDSLMNAIVFNDSSVERSPLAALSQDVEPSLATHLLDADVSNVAAGRRQRLWSDMSDDSPVDK